MKKENAKQNILPRMLVLALVFLFAGFPPGVVGYAREALPQATLSAALPAVQIFATSGGDPYQTNQQVGYALTGDTAETPMPAGSAGNRYDFTMAGNSTGSIVIDYPAEGTFQYTINEEIPSGFAYEWTPTRYRITVYAYGSTPIVIMKNDAGEKVPELHWTYVSVAGALPFAVSHAFSFTVSRAVAFRFAVAAFGLPVVVCFPDAFGFANAVIRFFGGRRGRRAKDRR